MPVTIGKHLILQDRKELILQANNKAEDIKGKKRVLMEFGRFNPNSVNEKHVPSVIG